MEQFCIYFRNYRSYWDTEVSKEQLSVVGHERLGNGNGAFLLLLVLPRSSSHSMEQTGKLAVARPRFRTTEQFVGYSRKYVL